MFSVQQRHLKAYSCHVSVHSFGLTTCSTVHFPVGLGFLSWAVEVSEMSTEEAPGSACNHGGWPCALTRSKAGLKTLSGVVLF